MKKSVLSLFILLIFIGLTLSYSGIVLADDNEDVNDFEEDRDGNFDDLVKEAEEFDEELDAEAGLTPDSAFYFLDKLFDNFASDAEVRKEKIAEMRKLAEACGQRDESACENLDRAFERYKKHADEFEKEVSPAEREEASRSSRAIRGVVIKEIAQNVPPGEKDELIRKIVQKEKGIETAAKIASKIKELCKQLSELDPLEYSRVCSTGDDVPRWQRDLHKDLTNEQKKEVKAFFNIMTECMSTSGRECRCEDISVSAFAQQCAVVAPLAIQCDEGDENACDEMEVATKDIRELVPDYLQDVLERLEGRFKDEQFDKFTPRECVEAGARTKEDCFQVMFMIHAPSECVDALKSGEISVSNEREAREACEEIMFKENAPEKCIEAGLRDPKECGALMFRENAPEKCIEAGLTGDNRGDEKECRRIMEGLQREFEDRREPHGGFGGANCRSIENPEKRLACYDGAIQGAEVHHEDRKIFNEKDRETKQAERQCAESCYARGGAWDFSNGECQCRIEDRGEIEDREEFRMPSECEGLSPEECRQKFEEEFIPPKEEFVPPEDFEGEQLPIEGGFEEPSQEPASELNPESESKSTTEEGRDSGITGRIILDNRFFNYYFR